MFVLPMYMGVILFDGPFSDCALSAPHVYGGDPVLKSLEL